MSDTIIPKHSEEIEILKQLGFKTVDQSFIESDLDQVWQKGSHLIKGKADLEYPVDGLVIKLNDNLLVQKLGVVGKTFRGWSALKSHQKEVSTRLLGVTWQVGRTGKLTPVAELEPVELDGTTVRRATLHNYKEFVDSGLLQGDWLIVRKAGDIIPEVVDVLKNLRVAKTPNSEIKTKIKQPDLAMNHESNKVISSPKINHFEYGIKLEAPMYCPYCSSKLEKTKTEVDLFCPNTYDCKEQVILRISYFASRNQADIDGLSRKIIEKFVDLYGVKDFVDLYDLPWNEIIQLEGFGMKSVNKLRAAIDKTRRLKPDKLLAALGIDGIGPEIASLIIENTNFDNTN